MEKIILDTNFLLAVFELKLDIFTEIFRVCPFSYELYVLDKTVMELEKLINTPLLSKQKAAKAALKLVKEKGICVLQTSGPQTVDDVLVGLNGYVVATADRALRRRLREKGVKVLYIRQGKYLRME